MILTRHVLQQNDSHSLLWIADNYQYEVITGSHAYGCQTIDSDFDIYGFTIPPKEYLFPSLFGYIPGFSTDIPNFDQLQVRPFNYKKTTAEGQIYNIVKFFKLCMGNNPNMIDTLFVRDQCVTHCTKIGSMVRSNRELFLSKKCWHTFKGYAYSQMSRLETKNPDPDGKRAALREKYGYDVKFAYHIVRLLNEVEQLLETGSMDLMLHNEQLKSIRRGEWTIRQIKQYFEAAFPKLEKLYDSSQLPHKPNEKAIRILLINCLEEFYGDLAIQKNANIADVITDLQEGLDFLQEKLTKYK